MKTTPYLFLALLLAGCNTVSQPNSGTAKEVTAILQAVQTDVQAIKDKQHELTDAQAKKDQKAQETLQFISDRVFIAKYANFQTPVQSPYTQLVDLNLGLVQKVAPPASTEAKAQAILDLEQSLSQEKKDKEELQKRYNELAKKADELKVQSDQLATEVSNKKKELEDVTAKSNENVKKLADTEAQVRIKAAEAEEQRKIARTEAASKVRLKVASGFMVAGGVVVVAAIVATICHVAGVLLPGVVGGISFLLVGWLITYVEDLLLERWFQYTIGAVFVGGLLILGLVIFRALKQRKKAALDAKISTNAIGALQDLKNDDRTKGTDTFEKISPYLNEWHQTKDGKPDEEVQKEIDRRLVEMNLKAAAPAVAA